jgi:DNA polymerase I-like protein with 3'-5' exonuclease and polymerase domains
MTPTGRVPSQPNLQNIPKGRDGNALRNAVWAMWREPGGREVILALLHELINRNKTP